MLNNQPPGYLPWDSGEYAAFVDATRDAVDGDYERGERIADVRNQLLKSRPTMLRMLELRRHKDELIRQEQRP